MRAIPWVLSVLAVASLGSAMFEAQGLSSVVSQKLIEAVRNGDGKGARAMLAQGADVNSVQPDGATALHWAAYHDDSDTAAILLKSGAEPNVANDFGATPLWLACANGSLELVDQLLASGADPTAALPKGETILMTASRTGVVGVVKRLLSRGAEVNAREDTRGQTALMWAVAQRNYQVVQALIDAGANLHVRSLTQHRLVYTERMNGAIFDQGVLEAQGGFTPLLFAARSGDVESARLLVAAGANVNVTAPNGASALVIAAHSNHEALATFLLEHGALVNTHGAGYAALHAAVLRGNVRLVKTLLTHGADPNMPFTKGTQLRRTSRDWALMSPWIGATPFWLAAQFREPEIMEVLAGAGAIAQLADDGTSPLMAAISGDSRRGRGFLEAVEDPVKEERLALSAAIVAVDFGSPVNGTAKSGNTVLHMAAASQLNSVVEFLVAKGASLDAENDQGHTPLAMAIGREGRRSITILEDNRPADTEPMSQLLLRLGAMPVKR